MMHRTKFQAPIRTVRQIIESLLPGWEPVKFHLIQLQRAGVQLVVGALELDQILMGAALDDASMVEYHDGIGILYGGQTVRDDEAHSVFPSHER